MTRSISEQAYNALRSGSLVDRDFLWFQVRRYSDGSPVYDGMWSDVGDYTAQVIDPDTGGIATRSYVGTFTLVRISDIALVSNLTVQTITIDLAQCSGRVNDLLRGYDCKQGIVQIHRGLFDPATREQAGPALSRFYGLIDDIKIPTPKAGEDGPVEIICTSHTQELTRASSDTRSDASQRRRGATDKFYQDVANVGDRQHFWGRTSGAVGSSTRSVTAGGGGIG
ncbi:hypothetical protein [Rhodopseudomonas pseudopalustris]|uniref:Uncharacterized protein n=1 Tax=Rhodopseudomonas pseudopalustris TaxID=1513892 RepID=A0A1H8V8G4_9BRAD|nr:hypothetical protein [Rhodopseudomonas pseudopalustris]SEP11611.1 hypothetical protein SAMN05444123_108116 [Rhodopseudomonas pseudopalustris]